VPRRKLSLSKKPSPMSTAAKTTAAETAFIYALTLGLCIWTFPHCSISSNDVGLGIAKAIELLFLL
jgi:hypothetical protein